MGMRLYAAMGGLPVNGLEQKGFGFIIERLWDSKPTYTTESPGAFGLFARLGAENRKFLWDSSRSRALSLKPIRK